MKNLFWIMTFMLSLNSFAIEDCRKSSDFRVLSQYMHYDYVYENGEHRLLKKEKRTTEIFNVWSEVAGELFEVYLESQKESLKADEVKVSYTHKDNKLYSKSFVLEDASLEESHGFVQKISQFTFSEGVRPKEKRPGVQTYLFLKEGRPLCEIKVKHIYAEEDR